jgi:quercetin dioxygenase-like cupin family protein
MPANVFLHRWNPEPGTREGFHDHPRWSITICLKGRITEITPWGRQELRPGSVVIRSRKAIHAFEVGEDHKGETYTLFIVGRRKHRQNTYIVTPR